MLVNAMNAALSAPTSGNTDCPALFNVNGKGIAPNALLLALYSGKSDYGSIRYGVITDPKYSATTEPYLAPPGASFISAAIITLNNSTDSNWFWNTAQGRAITILHELGHAYNKLWGPGSSSITDESSVPQEKRTDTSVGNTNLIKEKCFK